MALGEFDIIQRYFVGRGPQRGDVALGIGDDCAVLDVPEGMQLVVTVDTLVEGVHFPKGTAPGDIGYKTLAASLSDIASMGAAPAWATLAVSLPKADAGWLSAFAEGLFALAERHGVQLVGGDTVRGPLTLSLQLMGLVPRGAALRRSGARPGDRVFVTGTLGDAGAGLQIALGRHFVADPEDAAALRRRLDRPEPRVEEGGLLRGLASAAIDVSDGLAADLGHILEASGVGATIEVDRLPLSDALLHALTWEEERTRLALGSGDDYELCFTVPPERLREVERALIGSAAGVSCIGRIDPDPGLRLVRDGRPYPLHGAGYNHFKGDAP